MEEKEIWKPIPGFEGRYEVSNIGRVRSLVANHNGRCCTKKEKILKQATNRLGYSVVRLTDDNKSLHTFTVHRLVMIAFIGLVKGKEVNHINGIKSDNRVENLEYLTHLENMQHAIKTGLFDPHDGRNGVYNRIPVCAFKDGCLVGEYVSINEMCRQLKLNHSLVRLTLRCKRNHHNGYTFKLLN
jgi:hypothetical protein